jgi:hypothetical protein
MLSFDEEALVGHANFEEVPSSCAAAQKPGGNCGRDYDGFCAHPSSVSTLGASIFRSRKAAGREWLLLAEPSPQTKKGKVRSLTRNSQCLRCRGSRFEAPQSCRGIVRHVQIRERA